MDRINPIYRSKTGILLLSWHGFSILWGILIGATGGDWKLVVTLALWTVLAVALYGLRPRFFVLVGIGLAVLEEGLVYSMGGGLQGKAVSLSQDLIQTMPLFTGFTLGWFISLKLQPWTETALYVSAGLHGFVLEFVTSGLIWHLTAVLLLGGPAIFIYGSLVLIPRPPQPMHGRTFSVIRGVGLWWMTLLLMIATALVADHLLRLGQ